MALGPDIFLDDDVYVHDTACLYGRIRLEQGVSIWPQVVMRAESQAIAIGAFSNVQDFAMLHIGDATPTLVGRHCSIGHRATLHGCSIGDATLVGIGATVMDGAVVGRNCIIAPHSLVREGQVIPDDSVVAGTPAKVVRTRNNYVRNKLNAFLYHLNARAYAQGDHRAWDRADFNELLQTRKAAIEAELAASTAAQE